MGLTEINYSAHVFSNEETSTMQQCGSLMGSFWTTMVVSVREDLSGFNCTDNNCLLGSVYHFIMGFADKMLLVLSFNRV